MGSNLPAPKAIPASIVEIDVLWATVGLGCDGDTVSITAATQPSIEDTVTGALRLTPKANFLNPFLATENGDAFREKFHLAAEDRLRRQFRVKNILVQLSEADGRGTMMIKDDGAGMVEPPDNYAGMGLQIMKYRADMIGGVVEIRGGKTRTTVSCRFPIHGQKR